MADGGALGDGGNGGILSFIGSVFKTILDADKWIGVTVAVALLIVMVAILGAQSGVFSDGFFYLVKMSWVPLAVGLGFIVVAKAAGNAIYGHIIMSAVIFVSLSFILQAMSGNRIPFFPWTYCYGDPWAPECPLSPIPPGTLAQGKAVDSVDEASAVDQAPAEVPSFAPGPGLVYIQFAGSIPREDVAKVALELEAQGWNVQEPESGGQRTASAAGLNEVRFFHPEDRAAAEQLAQAFLSSSADWLSGSMRVRDFSSAGLQAPEGQLEVWTSK